MPDEKYVEIKFTADQALIDQIQKLRKSLIPSHGPLSVSDVFMLCVDATLERLEAEKPQKPLDQ